MNNKAVIIVGGGLAGLSTAILLRRANIPVILLEKDTYPRQKVCGEYISVESELFVQELGINTSALPHINTLELTSLKGRKASITLKTGGFGISRWSLDHQLASIAIQEGVDLRCNINVRKIGPNYVGTADGQMIEGLLVAGAYGKSNPLSGILLKKERTRFIGVKYHVESDAPEDVIEMHVFRNGYCGFSKVDQNLYCLCYIAKSNDLKTHSGDFETFENIILHENPHLKNRMKSIKVVQNRVTTSQFHFTAYRGTTIDQQLLLGDATGFIPPITGNGMSLAFRSAYVTSKRIEAFYNGSISKNKLLKDQNLYVQKYVNNRIQQGVFLQSLLLKQNWLTDAILFNAINAFPFIGETLARTAVGDAIK